MSSTMLKEEEIPWYCKNCHLICDGESCKQCGGPRPAMTEERRRAWQGIFTYKPRAAELATPRNGKRRLAIFVFALIYFLAYMIRRYFQWYH